MRYETNILKVFGDEIFVHYSDVIIMSDSVLTCVLINTESAIKWTEDDWYNFKIWTKKKNGENDNQTLLWVYPYTSSNIFNSLYLTTELKYLLMIKSKYFVEEVVLFNKTASYVIFCFKSTLKYKYLIKYLKVPLPMLRQPTLLSKNPLYNLLYPYNRFTTTITLT